MFEKLIGYVLGHTNEITYLVIAVFAITIINKFYKDGLCKLNNDEIGIIYRNLSLIPFLSNSKFGKISMRKYEAGIRPQILTSRINWVFPYINSVTKSKIIKIGKDEVGIVNALHGEAKPFGTNFPPVIDCDNYKNAYKFLKGGGCKGIQLDILTSGIWEINTEIFEIIIEPAYTIGSSEIGIVTTFEGKLLNGEIAGNVVPNHNQFRDAQAFIKNGGYMGLQVEILGSSKYELNPYFISVKKVPITKIDATEVGVLQSRFGKEIKDSNADVLVEEGYKGVLKEIRYSGDHKINTDIYNVFLIPLNNITLEWNNDEKTDKGRYDANLKAIKLNSKDKYEFIMPLTQTIRIMPESAPLLIKRMGVSFVDFVKEEGTNQNSKKRYESVRQFVYRFLEPLVKSTFQQISQEYQALQFYEKKSAIQNHVATLIKDKLLEFGVEAISTVISDIDLPDSLDERIKNKQEIVASTDKYEKENLDLQHKLHQDTLKAINEGENKIKEAEAFSKVILLKYGSYENYLTVRIFEILTEMKVPIVPSINSVNSKDSPTDLYFLQELIEKIKLQINNPTINAQVVLDNQKKQPKKIIIDNTN